MNHSLTSIIKKLNFLLFFTLTLVPLSAAPNHPFSFDCDFEMGVLNGNIYEYVLPQSENAFSNKISMLDWQVKSVPYIGLNIKSEVFNKMVICLNGKTAVSSKSGVMQDYDWTSDNPFELTHYSNHQNFLLSFYEIDFSLGYNFFLLNEKLKLSPLIAYNFYFTDFDARDGYKNYKGEAEIAPGVTGYITGSAICYTQEYHSLLFGAQMNYKYSKKFYFDFNLAFSPLLTFVACLDNHKKRKTYFLDKIDNASLIKVGAKASYFLDDMIKFSLSSSITYVPQAKGETFINNYGSSDNAVFLQSAAYGGVKSVLWSLSLNVGVVF